MNPFIIFQLKIGFSIALFSSLYHLLFRKETFYLFNRLYLLISLLLSLLLPVIKFSDSAFVNPQIFTVIIDSVSVHAGNINLYNNIRMSIFELIYFSVCVLFIIHFIYQFVYVFVTVKKSQIFRIGKYRVVKYADNKRSFSFFNLIFLSSEIDIPENDQIMIHEMSHVSQRHSFDLLFLQLIKVFQWFNPFIYLLEKSLKETHEFFADQEVINRNSQTEKYKELLVARAFGITPGFLSFFNYSLIKNRLVMLTKEKSPSCKRFKYLLVFPLIVFLAYILSCENNPVEESLTSTTAVSNPNDTTFSFVDEMATFQDGTLENFKVWIQKNLVYPPLAVEGNISGQVVVSFVVNNQGKIVDVKVIKSPDDLLTKEVLRIINKSPDWKAAKIRKQKVNQQFIMPVTFQLE